ncbi:hypothetical protein L9F63_019509, partial [Diploptera punctata]
FLLQYSLLLDYTSSILLSLTVVFILRIQVTIVSPFFNLPFQHLLRYRTYMETWEHWPESSSLSAAHVTTNNNQKLCPRQLLTELQLQFSHDNKNLFPYQYSIKAR